MGVRDLFSRKTTEPEQKAAPTLSQPDAWLFDLFGASPAASGVSVTPQNAMKCAAVRCAVLAISEAIGQLPVHVYKRDADGTKERDTAHPAFKLLHDQANDWTAASDMREQLARDALLFGNGYGFINFVDGKPYEITRLDPASVTVELDLNTGEPIYKLTQGRGGQRTIARQNLIHIRAPGINGTTGESPVLQAREAIGLSLVMEGHAARLFGNGARPSGILAAKESMSAEALMRAKAIFEATHGNGKSGGTALIPADVQWSPVVLSSVDAQFMELRKFAIAEISRAFRVPPVLLMDYERQTWANAEEGGRQFVTYSLMPWIKRFEGEFRLKLFRPEERETHFAEFLTDDLLRADYATRMDGYSKAISARILNPNEVRAAENRAPYEGGDAYQNPNTTTTEAPANDDNSDA